MLVRFWTKPQLVRFLTSVINLDSAFFRLVRFFRNFGPILRTNRGLAVYDKFDNNEPGPLLITWVSHGCHMHIRFFHVIPY